MSIQLVLQCAGGGRLDMPGQWSPSSTLAQVMESVQSMLPPIDENATLRYLQTTVSQVQWSSTRLQDIGLMQGRALLILSDGGSKLSVDESLSFLLQNNFDADSKPCIVTLIKVLDNVLQNPGNQKVRSIRLTNAAFDSKVGQRKGGVDFLLACGFVRQTGPPQLLSSNAAPSEETLVLLPENESTTHLASARRLLTTRAIKDLGMDAEDLPKSKPLPKVTSASDHAAGRKSGGEFNPYRGHRFDGMSAAIGTSLGPEGDYVSPTETQLKTLKQQERKLEASIQKPLLDRGLVAGTPNNSGSVVSLASAESTTTTGGGGDGSLLASKFQKMEAERKQREEGGFTTKAMRDVEKLKNKKVYSHASLRIQFPDGSFLQAKFLPKEFIKDVVQVIQSCFISDNLDFDLYVAPPRRKLDPSKTLQQEGLVPAAKVFCSWKVNKAPPKGAVGSFLKPELFAQTSTEAMYPTAKPVAGSEKKKAEEEKGESREEEMMRRMMGGGKKLGGGGSKTKPSSNKSGKPKWFKG